MKIRIFQIDSERDVNRVMFSPLSRLEELQGNSEVDYHIYRKVYEANLEEYNFKDVFDVHLDIDKCNLEDIYAIFNIYNPEDYTARSLSVSDVVEVCSSNNEIEPGFYYCDAIGFKKIEFGPQNSTPREVVITMGFDEAYGM